MDAPAPLLSPIILAHEPSFRIGTLEIRPETCELVHDGGSVIVEPRVMQVLVALHQAGGHVVSRDDLLARCWAGRIVGEDSIHRVISRLRQDGLKAGGHFRIETITRVGYRLVAASADGADGAAVTGAASAMAARPQGWSRRSLLLASGGAIGLAGAGAAVWALRQAGPPEEAVALVRSAEPAIAYGTVEQMAIAIATLREATRIAPDWAEAWGKLALAYAQQAYQASEAERRQLRERSNAAMARALQLDAGNIDAQVSSFILDRGLTTRVEADERQRRLLASAPDHPVVNLARAGLLSQVGRNREAVTFGERAIARGADGPPANYMLAGTLAAAGRPDEADALFDRTLERWPRHYGAWFTRYKNFLYTGRVAAAIGMLADEAGRPAGIAQYSFRICEAETRALATRLPRDIEAAMAIYLGAARVGVGFAQNAIIFSAAVGRIDSAFEVADAYFFDRGWVMPEQRYTSETQLFSARRQRPSHFFFDRPLAAMRADPRFAALMKAIGLEEFWTATGIPPDYRR